MSIPGVFMGGDHPKRLMLLYFTAKDDFFAHLRPLIHSYYVGIFAPFSLCLPPFPTLHKICNFYHFWIKLGWTENWHLLNKAIAKKEKAKQKDNYNFATVIIFIKVANQKLWKLRINIFLEIKILGKFWACLRRKIFQTTGNTFTLKKCKAKIRFYIFHAWKRLVPSFY